MEGIFELLNSDTGRKIIQGVSNETKQPTDKTSQVVSMALPLLMGAMSRNSRDSKGAQGLMGALDQKHDGSILDHLDDFFGGGVNEEEKIDGLGILGHVLGGSQDNVVGALSKKSGMDSSSVMQILQVIAPIVLGYLGKQKRQQHVEQPDGLAGLLGGLMGNGQQVNKQQSLIESLLDGDNDGSVLDDVASMVLSSGNSRKSGLGGLLGGLFGK